MNRGWSKFPLGLVLVCIGIGGAVALSHAAGTTAVTDQVPLFFEELGDGRAQKFLSRAPGFHLELTSKGASLGLRRGSGATRGAAERGAVVRWEWVGADAAAVGQLEQPLPTRLNYFRGRDPLAWRTGIVAHARARFREMYPGIDLVFYGNDCRLEYDWVVAPGADPGRIGFRVEGVEKVRIADTGDLVMVVSEAELRQQRPSAYQWREGVRQEILSRFVLREGEERHVGFEVGEYDRTLPLVIDPVVLYSSFLGGRLFDTCRDVVLDALGGVVVVGETTSTDLFVTNALFETNGGGVGAPGNSLGNEAFVARFSPDGGRMLFATYLGGNQIDAALAVAKTTHGILIGGLTHSPDFPVTTNAWADQIAGLPFFGYYRFDGFLTELTEDGSAIRFSTYVGGDADDQVLDLVVGPGNRLYAMGLAANFSMSGMANLPEVIRTNVLYHGNGSAAQASFVLSFAEDESAGYLAWIAGNGITIPLCGKLDKVGRLLVVGRTLATDLWTRSAFQGQTGGSADGYVGRLLPGGDLDLMTYLGGSFDEEVRGVDVDETGRIHVAGYTTSTNFPVTASLSILSSTNSGFRDAFLVRLDASGTNQVYGTYVGGSADDEAAAIAVDATGASVVVGVTSSTNFPTIGGLQSTNAGLADGFVFQLNTAGTAFDYSTYLGGLFVDLINDLEPAADGTWWLVGQTGSIEQNLRWGAPGHDIGYGGGTGDGWVVRLTPAEAELTVAVLPGGSIRLSWPAVLSSFQVQMSADLADSGGWTDAVGTPVVVGNQLVLVLPPPAGPAFYRLRRVAGS